jgi:hypothetical protein
MSNAKVFDDRDNILPHLYTESPYLHLMYTSWPQRYSLNVITQSVLLWSCELDKIFTLCGLRKFAGIDLSSITHNITHNIHTRTLSLCIDYKEDVAISHIRQFSDKNALLSQDGTFLNQVLQSSHL